MKKLLLIACILITSNNFAVDGDDIIGTWFMPEDHNKKIPVAQIFKKGNSYIANGFAFKDFSHSTATDINNPDPKLHDRKIRYIVVFYNLKFNKGDWSGGKIYNPDNGKTFNLRATLSHDKQTLTLRASLDRTGLFGRTMIWTAVPNPQDYEKLKTPQKVVEENIPY